MKITNYYLVIKEYWISFLIFFSFIAFVLSFFYYNKNDRINRYLIELEKKYSTQYNITYEHFKNLSQNTFYGIVNKPEVYNYIKYAYKKDEKTQAFYRQRLYDTFLADYSRLKEYNFKQLHFHFPNNHSFLRMHKPSLFGDDLSSIRESIVKTNKTLKPVEGFEIGKVAHGFRFVYPLHDENLFHIGSIEASISSDFFEKEYEKNYNADVHFLVNKKLAQKKMNKQSFEKLHESDENSDYVFLEHSEEELYHFTSKKFYSKKEKAFIKEKMTFGDDFTLKKADESLVINFIAIKNVSGQNNSAYAIIYTKSSYLSDIEKGFKTISISLFLLSFIFIMIMYSKYKSLLELRRKEHIIRQQSKLASMGEMIGNISHQWRQPLSVISTSASGLKVQQEFGVLDEKSLGDSLENIVNHSMYLSETIEDFRNFFHEESERKPFLLSHTINKVLLVFEQILNENEIAVIKDFDDSLQLVSYEDDLKQVLSVLIKNSIEAINEDGVIVISTKNLNKKEILISIQDSGGGVDSSIKEKIFEPYFTTKHKNIGTGLGLYMAYETVNRNLDGIIEFENKDFIYSFKNLRGACFSLKIRKD